MAQKLSLKKRLEQFDDLCKSVKESTASDINETDEQKKKRIAKLRKNYGEFVKYYFPHYAKSECADFHIEAANIARKNKNLRAAAPWARGHAKSTHWDIMIPLWLKCQENRELNVMVLVGKSKNSAKVLLSDIQIELEQNQRYISDFGPQLAAGDWKDGEFSTLDGCAFFSLGRGQSPRGIRKRQFRPDYIVVDDLDDDILVRNPDRVQKLYDWLFEALFGAMDMGQGRFVMAANLISKNSVLYLYMEKLREMMAAPGNVCKYWIKQVNALNEDGLPSWPSKYSLDQILEQIKLLGYRRSQKELFNNPLTAGKIFRPEWWQWTKMLALKKYDAVVAYMDPSYKSTTSNDFKAIRIWGKTGRELHCIKSFCRQCSMTAAVKWLYDWWESVGRENDVEFYMEQVFLQDTLLDDFDAEGEERGYNLPIRGDKRAKPPKDMRIEAIAAYYERGMVYYNEVEKNSPDMIVGNEQVMAFEKGSSAHNDAPDADEGAVFLLQRKGRQSKTEIRVERRPSHRNGY